MGQDDQSILSVKVNKNAKKICSQIDQTSFVN